ncbi:MAG: SEC-C metal-binding domain-containing protein [Terracidiphilus sp.]
MRSLDSSEKIGRNDRCPCGSGKKYKHCCLRAASASSAPVDTPWSRQREASDRLTPALLKVAGRLFGDDLVLAWAEFNQVPFPKPLDTYPNEEAIFSPYLIFDWDPESPRRRRSGKPRAGAVLRAYLAKSASRLSELELLILEQAVSRPVSFYEIIRCNPGQSAALRDILVGEETEVEEHSGTKTMRPGDIVYGQIWILPDVATLGRLAPKVIRPDRKVEIVELRARLRRKIAKQNRQLTVSDLVRYSEEIRSVYLDIRNALLRPKKLVNTDGEPFIFHTLTFRVGSAQVAFDALAPLAWGTTKAELLEDAEWNADGSLRMVEIDWIVKGNAMHKTWDNTILGHLRISGQTLIAEVNSANRATRIRQEVEKRLGLHVTHLSTTTETPEEAIAKREKQSKMASRQNEAAQPLDPEIQRDFAAHMQEEVEAWVHQKIPSLGGRTPIEAVADPDGREIVEGLLLSWQRSFEGQERPGTFRPDIDAVRRSLNLPVGIGTVIH